MFRKILLSTIVIFFFAMIPTCTTKPFDALHIPEGSPETSRYLNREDGSFYGIMEFFGGPVDFGMAEKIAPLAGAMGFKTFRISAHQDYLTERTTDNVVRLRQAGIEEVRNQIKQLKGAGIEHFIAMNHYYLYPEGFDQSDGFSDMGVFPIPGTDFYEQFLLMVEESYALMTAEFKDEIFYWESGNEVNGYQYCHKQDGGSFTFSERAQITTDLMFFAARGIKRGNPDAKAVMPGLIFNDGEEGIINYVKQIYANIRSGDFPTVGETKSSNPDDYFDLLNWHPYNWNGNSSRNSDFVRKNNNVYAEAIFAGDGGKKVIFSEFGYTTTEGTLSRQFYENRQERFLAQDYQNIYEFLPYVESVIIFRLFDWEGAAQIINPDSIEIGYGLFTGLATESGVVPKKMTLRLFQHIQGENADAALLYQFTT